MHTGGINPAAVKLRRHQASVVRLEPPLQRVCDVMNVDVSHARLPGVPVEFFQQAGRLAVLPGQPVYSLDFETCRFDTTR